MKKRKGDDDEGEKNALQTLFLGLVVGCLLDDRVAKRVDLRGVRAEPHEPHAHDRRPHNDAAESEKHKKHTTDVKKKAHTQTGQWTTTTNPRSFMKGTKVKITPSTANTSVAMPIEPQ